MKSENFSDLFQGLLYKNMAQQQYPMPLYALHKDEVLLERLQRDCLKLNALNMWIVEGNLRKGAATDDIQIEEESLFLT